MAKKQRKVTPFRKEAKVTYNKYKPNRAARRAGIKPEKPPKGEEKKTVSKIAVLSESVRRVRETTQRITPPGMTYREYMSFLKERQDELQGKTKMRYSYTKTINRG